VYLCIWVFGCLGGVRHKRTNTQRQLVSQSV
jgi:hypothetical protein